jgi:hypothetical protein
MTVLLPAVLVLAGMPASASETVIVPAVEQARIWSTDARKNVVRLLALPATDHHRIVASLDALRSDPNLDAATIDAIAYGYVAALRRGVPDAVPDAVLDRLASWSPLALRHHDESPALAVPLFDVATAAEGVRNEWRFHQGFDAMRSAPYPTMAQLLEPDTALDPAWVRGARNAIAMLPAETLSSIAAIPVTMPKRGGTDDPTIDVALALRDADRVIVGVADFPASEAIALLRNLSSSFSSIDAYDVAVAALDHGDAGVRSVAMASAGHIAQPIPILAKDWRQRLIGLLLDPDVGATAAMQLADAPDAALDAIRSSNSGDALLDERLELIARLRARHASTSATAGGRQ